MPISRRKLLIGTSAGLGVLAAGGIAARALSSPDLPDFLRRPIAVQDRDAIWHLVSRAGFGPKPGQVTSIQQVGATAWIDQQLHPASIDDHLLDQQLAAYTTLTMTPSQLVNIKGDTPDPMSELKAATELRAVFSQRQLFEVLVLFWSEHFSIWHGKDLCPYLKTNDDQRVIRAHALGKFRDLLGASAHSPAMLDYLDNQTSEKGHPNENYARELLELHTLAPGNYSEKDVKEVARCLTGWTFNQDGTDTAFGTFVFDPDLHDAGAKTVLNHPIPAGGGQGDMETVLDILASHPACARFISLKLCRRFIADDPPKAVVDAAAQTFSKTSGDIAAVVRTILMADAFGGAPPKLRRPFELLVALARSMAIALPAGKQGTLDFDGLLYALAHQPFNHFAPDGYKDVATHWRTNLLVRWNATLNLIAGNALTEVAVDPIAVAEGQGAQDPRAILDYYAQQCIGRALKPAESATLWAFVTKAGTPDLTTDDGKAHLLDAIGLLAIAPAAQYR